MRRCVAMIVLAGVTFAAGCQTGRGGSREASKVPAQATTTATVNIGEHCITARYAHMDTCNEYVASACASAASDDDCGMPSGTITVNSYYCKDTGGIVQQYHAFCEVTVGPLPQPQCTGNIAIAESCSGCPFACQRQCQQGAGGCSGPPPGYNGTCYSGQTPYCNCGTVKCYGHNPPSAP